MMVVSLPQGGVMNLILEKMKKAILLFMVLSFGFSVLAQESNGDKVLNAKSLLNQKAPELVVEKWVTKKPKTTGKFILIDFWGPACVPCKKAIPHLNEFSKRFKKDLVVIGISCQGEKALKEMKEPVIEYFSAYDTRKVGRISKALDVRYIPYVLLIDPQGIVRWEGNPLAKGYELTEEVIENLIKKYK